MDNLGIKTTLYDILGYIVPGLMLILSIFIIYNQEILDMNSLMKKDVSIAFSIIILIISYICGLIVSSASSLLFENKLIKNACSAIYQTKNEELDKKSLDIFNKKINEISNRVLVAYCQKHEPQLYDTAFVFLTLYGLSRNISTVIIVYLSSILISGLPFTKWHTLLTLALLLMLHNYFRFKRYYEQQITSSILLHDTK